ncbi:hypothetical protein BOVATA_005260 [Babesia ovata]|uniref:Secreted protein n=1 Tax=Babesia ovata TaxID=189622 RepID=A0A2H6K7Q8_9APIC|nr:uncharacterized protein BOVATA_005260 [Babesia ovata]GBE59033.1 hypothetical protein BOVATA_005260 [Babesia ovata]
MFERIVRFWVLSMTFLLAVYFRLQVGVPDQVDDPPFRFQRAHVNLLCDKVEVDRLVYAAVRLEDDVPAVLLDLELEGLQQNVDMAGVLDLHDVLLRVLEVVVHEKRAHQRGEGVGVFGLPDRERRTDDFEMVLAIPVEYGVDGVVPQQMRGYHQHYRHVAVVHEVLLDVRPLVALGILGLHLRQRNVVLENVEERPVQQPAAFKHELLAIFTQFLVVEYLGEPQNALYPGPRWQQNAHRNGAQYTPVALGPVGGRVAVERVLGHVLQVVHQPLLALLPLPVVGVQFREPEYRGFRFWANLDIGCTLRCKPLLQGHQPDALGGR